MSGLDLTLVAVGLAGVAMIWILFTKRFRWNLARFNGGPFAPAAPFWLALITLLSFAAILFSVSALLTVHGLLP